MRINWYMAARYCNWLSQAEGIPPEEWCYEIKGEELVTMRPKYLSLTGYRLPTESEYEYATRRRINQPILRRDGRPSGQVRVVPEELPESVSAGGSPEAKRSGVV